MPEINCYTFLCYSNCLCIWKQWKKIQSNLRIARKKKSLHLPPLETPNGITAAWSATSTTYRNQKGLLTKASGGSLREIHLSVETPMQSTTHALSLYRNTFWNCTWICVLVPRRIYISDAALGWNRWSILVDKRKRKKPGLTKLKHMRSK